jgi:antitoxin (DNA-binding transcriptional repressor) of toxin-antitoxin stability system
MASKKHLSKLLDAVEKGAQVTVTRHGKPVAQIIPPPSKKKGMFGCAKGAGFYMAPDFDAPLEVFKDCM